jgi:crotonobetainyl-CoA:carnitine CoA-transferase CaiB-like acyl-CoA transferase
VKVLDLSCDVAGRFAAKLFAWSGAEVLRIAPAAPENTSLSVYLDAGKQNTEPAQLPALLDACDVVFTSFDRGHYCGHADSLVIPDGKVHVTTSSYGTTGPYAKWRGGSLADWAAGGYLFITGDPGREPLSGPENMCAYAAGYTAAFGVEAALIDKLRSGQGRHLDISTMESMLLLHQSTFARTAAGELRRRTGRFTEVYPLTVLPCRDGHVSIGVVTDLEFDKLSIAVGQPELPLDPHFADKNARWENREALDAVLGTFLMAHDADAIVDHMQAHGVAFSKVTSSLDITDNPQLGHRGYWEQVPGGGVMPGDPLRCFHEFAATKAAFPLPFRGGVGGGGCPANTAPTDGPQPNPVSGRPVPRTGLELPGAVHPETPEGEGLKALPLTGIKVLDFSIFWAGPSATRTLSDLGAEVVWVERPGSRPDTHIEEGEAASPADIMQHLYATKVYRGKQSITLDLEKAEDRKVAHALARDAHIVVENFRPGVADKLGIGPAELARINPALVYVSLSGWGADGPWAQWRSYGPSIEAASSIEGRTGYPGGEPLRLGHAFPDATGGLAGALAALRGLRQLLTNGQGGWYDISQLEVYAAMSGEGILEATRHGRGIERVGNGSRFGALQGVFPSLGEDQWIAIRLEDDADRACLAQIMAIAPEGLTEVAIAEYTRPHDKAQLAAQLQAQGLQAFPALNAHELAADPHLAARDYFLQVTAGPTSHAMPGTPLVATPRMADATQSAPRPGADAHTIRSSLKVPS